jgi:hypothetical protein
MGVTKNLIKCVMTVYEGATMKISTPGGNSTAIKWSSGTVQGCQLSPTLFNICLKPFLRRLEQPETSSTFLQLGFPVEEEWGEVITTNVGAYADDLIRYSAKRDGIDQMLDALAELCRCTHMDVNAKNCVSVFQTWDYQGIPEETVIRFKMKKFVHGMVDE